jgi:hypothetical protein
VLVTDLVRLPVGASHRTWQRLRHACFAATVRKDSPGVDSHAAAVWHSQAHPGPLRGAGRSHYHATSRHSERGAVPGVGLLAVLASLNVPTACTPRSTSCSLARGPIRRWPMPSTPTATAVQRTAEAIKHMFGLGNRPVSLAAPRPENDPPGESPAGPTVQLRLPFAPESGNWRTSTARIDLRNRAAAHGLTVGVAGFEPAASSSRSQVISCATSAAGCLTWGRPSVDVHWCPQEAVAIATHWLLGSGHASTWPPGRQLLRGPSARIMVLAQADPRFLLG